MASGFPAKLAANGCTTDGSDQQSGASAKVLIVTCICYVCVLLTLFVLINEEVPQPYMDEAFHVDQARKYCVGNFTQVRSALTTCAD